MISREIKDQIDKWANQCVFEAFHTETERMYIVQGIILGATKYAEQLEEKDKIIERKDLELAELKDLLTYYKDKADKGENILKSATDIHFIPGKEGDNLLAEKDRELAQLKEIAERMAKALIKHPSLITTPEQSEALIAWQTWRNSK